MTEYETDSVGGLMGQILAMTAPPGSRDTRNGVQNTYTGPSHTLTLCPQTESTGLAAHPYFRRPGKGHNRDSCDACSEGGDLICCDKCPASFHLTCHDPPLDEDNIPVGEWMCHQCRVMKQDDKTTLNKNGKTPKPPKKKEEMEEKVWTSGREMKVTNTPLSPLVMAAAAANPKQFSIPYELTVPANFPNEPKDTSKRNGRRGWGRKKPYELDNGLTPRPAILCTQCGKSCRIGPIIPCDYCTLYYHLDCVNPPLTIPPIGKWMCPSHPEHFLDSTLTSHSLTERVKIWDKFSGPLDEHSIKLSFVRKCNKERANNKFKVRKVTRSRIKVPEGVKNQYIDPPDLLPHLSSSAYVPMPPLVKKLGVNSLLDASDYLDQMENSDIDKQEANVELSIADASPKKSMPTEDEKKEWLLGLLHFQSDMFKEFTKPTYDATKITANGAIGSTEKQRAIVNGDLSLDSHSSVKSKIQKYKSGVHKNHKNWQYQRPVNDVKIVSETLTALGESLKHKIEHNGNIKIDAFDQTLLEVLAYERILSITSSIETRPKENVLPQIQARALLCPVVPDITLKSMAPLKSYSSEPVPMTFRILNIGKGSHNHVNLELFGNCNFISNQHAAIIYDQSAGSYELLNYSENGTNVDGIFLNCNFNDKTVSEAAAPAIMAQFREIADRNRGYKPHEAGDPPVMNSRPGQKIVQCDCRRRKQNGDSNGRFDDAMSHGWEGTSVLHHGSFIKFGCIGFVFSLVETAMHGDWASDVLVNYEKFICQEKEEKELEQKHSVVAPDQQTKLS